MKVKTQSPTHPPTHPPIEDPQHRIQTAFFSLTQPTHPSIEDPQHGIQTAFFSLTDPTHPPTHPPSVPGCLDLADRAVSILLTHRLPIAPRVGTYFKNYMVKNGRMHLAYLHLTDPRLTHVSLHSTLAHRSSF